ncbi:MAG: hemerythrin domain-containing protein [Betaproteobacteria bacterium]
MDCIDYRRPSAGFESPLALWLACHDRLQRAAQLLHRLSEHWRLHGPGEAARVTAQDLRRYFEESAPRHQADEQCDLFPRLRQRLEGTAEAQELGAIMERLDHDHDQMDGLWLAARDALDHCAQAPIRPGHADCFGRFIDSFMGHHEAEHQLLLPAAQRLLQPDDLKALGEGMAARRGTTWAALGQRP